MIECNELIGKVIRICRIDKDGSNGPEIRIEYLQIKRSSPCASTTDISIRREGVDERTRPRLVEDVDNPPTIS